MYHSFIIHLSLFELFAYYKLSKIFLITLVVLNLVYECHTQEDMSTRSVIYNSPKKANKDKFFIFGLSTIIVHSIIDMTNLIRDCSYGDMRMWAQYMM